MSYKKRFTGPNVTGQLSPISGANSNHGAWNNDGGNGTGGWNNDSFGYKNYQSRLPEVYTGHPNRVERYNQYEMMDIDAEINACLDIIAEFSTQKNDQNNTPFEINFHEDPTPHEVELIKKQLQQWCKLNEFDTRAFKIFRNAIKITDVQNASKIELEFNGKPYILPYEMIQGLQKHRGDISLAMWLGEVSNTLFADVDGPTTTATPPYLQGSTGYGVQTTRGMDSYITNYGINDSITNAGTFTLS